MFTLLYSQLIGSNSAVTKALCNPIKVRTGLTVRIGSVCYLYYNIIGCAAIDKFSLKSSAGNPTEKMQALHTNCCSLAVLLLFIYNQHHASEEWQQSLSQRIWDLNSHHKNKRSLGLWNASNWSFLSLLSRATSYMPLPTCPSWSPFDSLPLSLHCLPASPMMLASV